MIAASANRSRTPSRSAPAGLARRRRRAISPSTPSSTDDAWTISAPTMPSPAPSAHAPARAIRNAINETTSGWSGRCASVIDMRVEIGRLRYRETGPSTGLVSERRRLVAPRRRSSGVSTSCHHEPRGSEMASRGSVLASSVTAPASVASPRAAMLRCAANTDLGSRNAPQSIDGSPRSLENATTRSSCRRTRVPSAHASGSGA